MKKFLVLALFCAGLAVVAVGCGGSDSTQTTAAEPAMTEEAATPSEEGVEVGGEMMLPSLNIVENASNAPNLSTLVTAVTAADLGETLSGPGPFTVFAPTNEAFEAVDPATLESLLEPENKKQLVDVLTYHVVPEALTSADLKDGDKLTTVQGGELEIGRKGDEITVNGAKVEVPDVIDSNGVSYIIDSVLIPAK
jgi:uncharacterized surface protein with fasciclin (FAS1) repeats